MAAVAEIGVRVVVINLNGFLRGMNRMNRAIATSGRSALSSVSSFTSLGGVMLSVANVAAKAIVVGIGAIGVALTVLTGIAVTTAISFEDAFAGVAKTVDGLATDMGVLTAEGEELKRGLIELSNVTPQTLEELAAIAQRGGELGIRGRENLLEFTKTAAQISVTTGEIGQEVGAALVRAANISGVATDEIIASITKQGNVLTELGNTTNTTEKQILALNNNLIGAAVAAGFTASESLALAAAMSSVGAKAEAGGSTASRVLEEMTKAINGAAISFIDTTEAVDAQTLKLQLATGQLRTYEFQVGVTGKQMVGLRDDFIAGGGAAENFGETLGATGRRKVFKAQLQVSALSQELQSLRLEQGKPILNEAGVMLEKFARIAGVSAADFKQQFEVDALGAFQTFIQGLGREEGKAAIILEDLGLGTVRINREFVKLSAAPQELEKAINSMNRAVEEGNATQLEFQKRAATTKSRLLILKNNWRSLNAAIGDQFLPIIKKAADSLSNFLQNNLDPIVSFIETRIVPAIDTFIGRIGELVTSFQAGGLFGARAGSFGSKGLLATLGLSPEVIVEIETFFSRITTAIQAFHTGGLFGKQGGMGAQVGLLSVLGISSETQNIIKGVAGVVGSLIDSIGDLLDEDDPLGALFSAESLQAAVDAVILVAPDILTGIVDTISTFAANNIPAIQEAFATWATGFWDWVRDTAVPLAVEALNDIPQAIADWAASGETQEKLIKLGQDLGIAMVDGIILNVKKDANALAVLAVLTEALARGVLSLADTIADLGGQVLAGIIGGMIEELTGGDVEVFTVQQLKDTFINNVDWPAVGAGATLLIVEGIRDSTLALQAGAQFIVKEIEETLTELSEQLKAIGVFFITGIIVGIKEAAVDLFPQAMIDALRVAVDATTDFLQADSPSKLYAAFGLSMIEGLIAGWQSGAADLANAVTGLLGGLFGGGEEGGGPANIDLTSAIEQWEAHRLKIEENDLLLQNISLLTIPSLNLALSTYVENALELLNTHQLKIVALDQAIILIITKTLPDLKKITKAVFDSGMKLVDDFMKKIDEFIKKIDELAQGIDDLGSRTVEAVGDMVSEFEELENILQRVKEAADKAAQSISSLRGARAGAEEAQFGLGARRGLGFQRGTLGFTIPPGFPNDTFPILTTTGEEVLVAPVGSSINEIIANVFSQLTGPIRGAIQGVDISSLVGSGFSSLFGEGGIQGKIVSTIERLITSKISEVFEEQIGSKIEEFLFPKQVSEPLPTESFADFFRRDALKQARGGDPFGIESLIAQLIPQQMNIPVSFGPPPITTIAGPGDLVTGGPAITINFGDVTINNDMDQEMFNQRVETAVSRALAN